MIIIAESAVRSPIEFLALVSITRESLTYGVPLIGTSLGPWM